MARRNVFMAAGAAAIAVAIFSVWFANGPTNALIGIKEAAIRRDVADLEKRIDFPSFRSSMKYMVTTAIDESAESRKPAGVVGKLLVGAMLSPIIDAMVTPESIVMMFSGRFPQPRRAANRGADRASSGPGEESVEMSTSWDSLSSARVKLRREGQTGDGIAFVMHREGLSWRLMAVERYK